VIALNFDLATVRAKLGDKRFRRAEGYAERGAVRIIALEDGRVSAMVTGEGGDVYGVEIDEACEGLCSCPDFHETRACKHLGAVALVADGLDPGQARRLTGRFSRLRDALAFEDEASLAAIILRLARTVPGVFEALETQDGEDMANRGLKDDAGVIFT
jgi:uncharacterized Zn finger protein